MTAFPPLAIANAVLDEAARQGKQLTIMQMLKLVYISHGWSLGLLNEPLVNQQPEAWQHGPVFPSVYRAFRQYGSSPITAKATDPFGQVYDAALSSGQKQIIESVVTSYGGMHAFALSGITHQEGTPWSDTYRRGASADIPDRVIADHYKQLARERQPHA